MQLSRDKALQEIEASWLLEIGGDDTFRRAYDAMCTNGPAKWDAESFQERWQFMRRILPRLHPKDIAVLWSVSCGEGKAVTIADAEGNYIVSA